MGAPGTAARRAALDILRATRSGQLFDAARDRALSGLNERDARLAHEIAAGVLRHRRSLDAHVRRFVTDRWRSTPANLRDVLRIGAYQLLALDRVPPHAAVGTAVDLAKACHGAKSGAFVNAVLRGLARAKPKPRLDAAPDPTRGGRTVAQLLAERYSHPDWLVARWLGAFGRGATERLLEHHGRRPPLHLQPVRWTRDDLVAAAKAAALEVELPAGTSGLLVRARTPQSVPGYREGAFVVQGIGQAQLVGSVSLTPGSRVWDACAAPGGKTVALARTHAVVASDRSRVRLARLRETLRRTASEVLVMVADARHSPLRPGAVDVVWLDAPCSATGTIAQHPDARWRITPRRLEQLAGVQARLLDAVAPVPAPGGTVVYTTCSLEREENEAQVNRFLRAHPEYRRDQPDVFVFPPDSGADGGYLAVLRRA
ncbi:MAG TPA: transcription antitermination factor NusB [Gemmatimonadales bacterium]|nr:transcription antitermination factor NusB [Gemmatimonadales bacterium]